ncbi:sugar phosphate isomerase/epimerase family protein [Brenneria tiliae]|uniref:sugar phosphate isomerase/epimerase family protein n=1 Tax=Brenneria tiliae TaxID=2914984 RepID=UPI002014B572|nr:sugar phosphate isomerase/epimerase [Brenneria tiliae]MCL2897120.1 sugar phosphate isomerase/epimerase [Brenneria tiliae]MCL2904773.1 sugar phosphate isomerase/epimerase [Brenneria tiliae]
MIERMSGLSDEAGWDLATQIRAHRSLNWKYIELRNISGQPVDTLTGSLAANVARQLDDAGLKVNCLASRIGNWQRSVDYDFDTEIGELTRLIEISQLTGNKHIRIMSYLNNGYCDEKWRDLAINRIVRLVDLAAQGGIELVHENCSGWAGINAQNAKYLLDSIDSPYLKLLLDLGNGLSYQNYPEEFIQKSFNRIVHVHIKDGIRKKNGNVFYTFPGQGVARLKELIIHLLKLGYKGLFAIEPHIDIIVHAKQERLNRYGLNKNYLTYGRMSQELVYDAMETALNSPSFYKGEM